MLHFPHLPNSTMSPALPILALLLALSAVWTVSGQQTLCSSQPGTCQNNGICVMVGGETCCQCAPNFSGVNCANADSASTTCQVCPTVSASSCVCGSGSFPGVQSCPTGGDSSTTSCFSMDSTVETPTGPKSLSELEAHDKVLTVSELGTVRFEPVIEDIHYLPHVDTWFYRIQTETSNIKVTTRHYLHVGSSVESSELVVSDNIQVGDPLLVYRDGVMTVEEVRKVDVVSDRGVSNPLVASGRLVVGGVLASVYADDIPPVTPKQAHALLWPVRVMAHFNVPLPAGKVEGMPAWAFLGNLLRNTVA